MPDGLVIGEGDKDLAIEFAQNMHEMNVSPEVVHRAFGFRYQMLEQEQADLLSQDETDSQDMHALMISDLGPKQHQKNVAGLNTFLENLPNGLGEAIKQAGP